MPSGLVTNDSNCRNEKRPTVPEAAGISQSSTLQMLVQSDPANSTSLLFQVLLAPLHFHTSLSRSSSIYRFTLCPVEGVPLCLMKGVPAVAEGWK